MTIGCVGLWGGDGEGFGKCGGSGVKKGEFKGDRGIYWIGGKGVEGENGKDKV